MATNLLTVGQAADYLGVGLGSLISQLGADLGGHFATTLPLTSVILMLSAACASTMVFIVPRRKVVLSEELIEQAEVESGML